MAIAKIKKIEIIGLSKDRDNLLEFLQKQGVAQLINLKETQASIISQITSTDSELLEIEEAVTFLATFREQPSFLQSMAKIKPYVYAQELKEILNNFDWRGWLSKLQDLRRRLKDLHQEKERLSQRKQLLAPWRNLSLLQEEIRPTQHCGLFLGILANRDYLSLLEDSAKHNLKFFSEVINQDKGNTLLSIIYLKKDSQVLQTLLKDCRFNFISFGAGKGMVKDDLFTIDSEILRLDDQIVKTQDNIAALAKEQFNLQVIHDYLLNIKKKDEATQVLSYQRFTFMLSAWMREKNVRLLEKEISREFKEIALFILDPQPEENIPVALENKPLVEPFEFITGIYGMPTYNELDPTPFLAPFFFLYFGFCVSDVGYGFLLTLISGLVLKKFKLGEQGKKFFRLFLFCGISTIIAGALTGSWFGNAMDMLGERLKPFLWLKQFKNALVLLDPLKEPTRLLGIALGFGIAQVWFGNIVAAIGNAKNRRYLDILWDQVPMLTLLFGLTGFGLIFLNLYSNARLNLFKYATTLGAVALILTQGRAEKALGGKLFFGAYHLYSALSGYLSDILSYSRLWALGLVTGVMASTINLIAMQLSQIISSGIMLDFLKIGVTILVFMVIFVFGHALSFLMNLLGAFVHPLRLQFVEFFSKFFRAGGKAFKPFSLETKYIHFFLKEG